MKLSARNQLKGKVVEVHKGATTAHVVVDLGHGVTVTSSITNAPKLCDQSRRPSWDVSAAVADQAAASLRLLPFVQLIPWRVRGGDFSAESALRRQARVVRALCPLPMEHVL